MNACAGNLTCLHFQFLLFSFSRMKSGNGVSETWKQQRLQNRRRMSALPVLALTEEHQHRPGSPRAEVRYSFRHHQHHQQQRHGGGGTASEELRTGDGAAGFQPNQTVRRIRSEPSRSMLASVEGRPRKSLFRGGARIPNFITSSATSHRRGTSNTLASNGTGTASLTGSSAQPPPSGMSNLIVRSSTIGEDFDEEDDETEEEEEHVRRRTGVGIDRLRGKLQTQVSTNSKNEEESTGEDAIEKEASVDKVNGATVSSEAGRDSESFLFSSTTPILTQLPLPEIGIPSMELAATLGDIGGSFNLTKMPTVPSIPWSSTTPNQSAHEKEQSGGTKI